MSDDVFQSGFSMKLIREKYSQINDKNGSKMLFLSDIFYYTHELVIITN